MLAFRPPQSGAVTKVKLLELRELAETVREQHKLVVLQLEVLELRKVTEARGQGHERVAWRPRGGLPEAGSALSITRWGIEALERV